jgi:hypothetical protein
MRATPVAAPSNPAHSGHYDPTRVAVPDDDQAFMERPKRYRVVRTLAGGNQRGFDMKKLVLTTAALLAGTALAAAQGMNPPAGNKAEGASPAPSAQQKAPAEKTAPHAQSAPKQTTGQAPKADADAKAGADMKGDTSKGADMKAGAKDDTKAKESMQKNDDKAGKSAASVKSDNKSTADTKSKMSDDNKAATRDKNGKDNKSSAQTESKGKDSTTGQGAAGARAANLSSEQKTKIRTTIREKVKVQPETHVNFSISVGTRIPRTVHYHTLPAEVVSIYPAWRGYYFILVNDEIVIIEPSSFEIVAVIA